ncbi:hypothetical protein ACQ4PT_067093 [Festuca glaucescens]
MADHAAWHYDKRGLFSVKSAYKVLELSSENDRQAGTASGERGSAWEKNIWKQLWRLDCPPKVHHFLWHVGHDSMPLRMNIERKHIDLDTRCAICNCYFENGGHLFVTCSIAKKAWNALDLGHVRYSLAKCTSGMDLLDIILKLPYSQKMLAVAFLWCWWSERNKANRGERRHSLDELQYVVRMHADEWQQMLKKKPMPKSKGIDT